MTEQLVDRVVSRMRDLLDHGTEALLDVAREPAVRDLGSSLPNRLVEAVANRTEHCRRQLPAS